MRRRLLALLFAIALSFEAAPARAQNDWTVLAGAMTVPDAPPAVGVAFGHVPGVAGFEIEYFTTLGRADETQSSAGGILVSAIVHPYTRDTLQFYGLFGVGLYVQQFAGGDTTGGLGAKSIGGGVKIGLGDHLRLRVDYRLLVLGTEEDGDREPNPKHPQRAAVGLNLHF